jgi:hypothetical protein
MELGQREFFWLIEGLELERLKGHGELRYNQVL